MGLLRTIAIVFSLVCLAKGQGINRLDPTRVNPFRAARDTITGISRVENQRIEGWDFSNRRLAKGIVVNDTFVSCSFVNFDFVHTILRNNVFLNCHFQKVVFAGGEWVGNRHIGGEMDYVGLGNVESAYADAQPGRENTRIDSNEIVGVDVHDWEFGVTRPPADGRHDQVGLTYDRDSQVHS